MKWAMKGIYNAFRQPVFLFVAKGVVCVCMHTHPYVYLKCGSVSMPFFLWNTEIVLIIFVLPAVHKTHTSWGDMDAVVWLRYEDICNQSDFGEVTFLDGWSRPSEDPEGVFVAVGFLGCFARVQKAASLSWWWNAASWASPGNASDSQCSQRAHNKYNLKSLICCGQHLKGEEEKGGQWKSGEWENALL